MFCQQAKPRAGVAKISSGGEKLFVTTSRRKGAGGEMADTLALGASAARHGGSSPLPRTKKKAFK